MLGKSIFTSAFFISLTANAAISTQSFSPVLKANYPLSIDSTAKNGLVRSDRTLGYLANFSEGYIDISKHFSAIDEVCFELDTQYAGSGSTPGNAGVYLFSYFVGEYGYRGNNTFSGRGGSLARQTIRECFNLSAGFNKSFIQEGKIAFTPYTTETDVTISDVRVFVTGNSKIKGELVNIDTSLNMLGVENGMSVIHHAEPNVVYSMQIVDNKTIHGTAGGQYSTLGVVYTNLNGDRVLDSVSTQRPIFASTQDTFEFFLVGSDTSDQGNMTVNIQRVNID